MTINTSLFSGVAGICIQNDVVIGQVISEEVTWESSCPTQKETWVTIDDSKPYALLSWDNATNYGSGSLILFSINHPGGICVSSWEEWLDEVEPDDYLYSALIEEIGRVGIENYLANFKQGRA